MGDALGHLVGARRVEAVWAILIGELARYGFDRLIYGFTRFRTGNGLGHRDDMLVLTNHKNEYVQGFFGEEMFLNAPMTQWAVANEGAKSWSYLESIRDRMTPAQRAIVEFNRKHDVVAGYTISFADGSERQKGAIALTGKSGLSQDDVDAIWSRDGERINLLCQVAHLRIITLPLPSDLRRLSRRQRQVLEWVGDGKTMQDIATILELKPATVEKHLRNAREVLNVDTTAQAVMKASLQRQIFVTDL